MIDVASLETWLWRNKGSDSKTFSNVNNRCIKSIYLLTLLQIKTLKTRKAVHENNLVT